MAWPWRCSLRGHHFSILNMAPGRVWLECAHCGHPSPGWQTAGWHIRKDDMQLQLRVTERTERDDGTIRIYLTDPQRPGASWLYVTEIRDAVTRFALGDMVDVSLSPAHVRPDLRIVDPAEVP